MDLIIAGFLFIAGGIFSIIAGILHYADIILIALVLLAIINAIGRKVIRHRNEKEYQEAEQDAAELEAELEYMATEYDWTKEP